MASATPRSLIEISYHHAAQEYLRNLPPEHFMEATAQGTQRKITLESLDLVHARRPEVQIFNELLVQYPRKGERRPGQVVPDNMVVVCDEPIHAEGSFDVPLQPVKPFWVLEYVSKNTKRKDYEDNFIHYEKALKTPYYLVFYPDAQDLTLYRHNGKKYVSVVPGDDGRHTIAELEIEVALLDGWVRFWFRGKLLPLPADLQKDVDELTAQLTEEKRRVEYEKRRADNEQQRADAERQRADHFESECSRQRENQLALEKQLDELREQIAGHKN